jgi:hypothetical protein
MTREILEQMTLPELGEYLVGIAELLADRIKAGPSEVRALDSPLARILGAPRGDSIADLRARFDRYVLANEVYAGRARLEMEAERLKASGASPN